MSETLNGTNPVKIGKKVNTGFLKLDKLPPGKQFIDGFLNKILDMPVQNRTRPGVVLTVMNSAAAAHGISDGDTAKVPLGEAVREDLPLLEVGAAYRFQYTGSEKSGKGNDTKHFDILEIETE